MERKNKTLKDDECHVVKFWFTLELMEETILTANRIFNRIPHSKTQFIYMRNEKKESRT